MAAEGWNVERQPPSSLFPRGLAFLEKAMRCDHPVRAPAILGQRLGAIQSSVVGSIGIVLPPGWAAIRLGSDEHVSPEYPLSRSNARPIHGNYYQHKWEGRIARPPKR